MERVAGPTALARRVRASHSSGGAPRRRKSIGSSARRWRRAVTRSKTGRGKGPNEPVLRLATAGSSSMFARAAAQHVFALLPEEGEVLELGEVRADQVGARDHAAGDVAPVAAVPAVGDGHRAI